MRGTQGARWFVVQTQVNGEAKAAQNLKQQGYDVYLPCYLKRRRHARKVDFTAKPLFPRYMRLTVNGDGNDALDFTYIGDLVQGVLRCIALPDARNQTFNLTYGGARTLNQIESYDV